MFPYVYFGLRPLSFDASNTISLTAINKITRSLRLNEMKLPVIDHFWPV